jgi:hypothetical protein
MKAKVKKGIVIQQKRKMSEVKRFLEKGVKNSFIFSGGSHDSIKEVSIPNAKTASRTDLKIIESSLPPK